MSDLTWRATFWFCFAFGVFVTIVLFFFYPETYRDNEKFDAELPIQHINISDTKETLDMEEWEQKGNQGSSDQANQEDNLESVQQANLEEKQDANVEELYEANIESKHEANRETSEETSQETIQETTQKSNPEGKEEKEKSREKPPSTRKPTCLDRSFYFDIRSFSWRLSYLASPLALCLQWKRLFPAFTKQTITFYHGKLV